MERPPVCVLIPLDKILELIIQLLRRLRLCIHCARCYIVDLNPIECVPIILIGAQDGLRQAIESAHIKWD